LARKYHPDVNQNDETAEEKFKEINEAYSVLNDSESRKKYDRYGDDWKHADQFEQANRGGNFRQTFRSSNRGGDDQFSVFGGRGGSIYEEMFGGPGVNFRPPPAEYRVDVTLEEAFHGASRLLQTQDGRRLEVKIPAGVDNGSRVHISPGGDQGGNLYLVISVKEHQTFRRQGRDLYVEVELPLDEAMLGTELSVPTLTGKLALTVPPETPNGRRFRLSGQGMPTLTAGPNSDTPRGVLYATTKVVLPTELSDDDREFFRKLRRDRLGETEDQPAD
jgi:DnaJ-class molecular chaperone